MIAPHQQTSARRGLYASRAGLVCRGFLACTSAVLLGALPLLPSANAQNEPPAPDTLPDSAELTQLDEQLKGTVGPGWKLNFRLAQKSAAGTQKDLILLFTGSDWVDVCKKFDTEIVNTDEFYSKVSDRFELVRFDFPRELPQSEALQAQNQLLMTTYRVQGFPTVMLTDASGRPYAVNGYQVVSAVEYATILTAMQAVRVRRDEKFAAAANAQGLEKAQLLADGIPTLPGNLAAWFYRPQLETLIANDLQNQTGKAVQYQRLINDVDYARTMAELSRKVEWSKMVSLTDDYIRGNQLKGEELQHALLNKVGILEKQGKTRVMVQTLLEIVNIDSETSTGARAQGLLDRMRLSNLQANPLAPSPEGDAKAKEEDIKP